MALENKHTVRTLWLQNATLFGHVFYMAIASQAACVKLYSVERL